MRTTKAPAVLACSVTQGPSIGLRVSSTKPRLSMALTRAEVMKSCRACIAIGSIVSYSHGKYSPWQAFAMASPVIVSRVARLLDLVEHHHRPRTAAPPLRRLTREERRERPFPLDAARGRDQLPHVFVRLVVTHGELLIVRRPRLAVVVELGLGVGSGLRSGLRLGLVGGRAWPCRARATSSARCDLPVPGNP